VPVYDLVHIIVVKRYDPDSNGVSVVPFGDGNVAVEHFKEAIRLEANGEVSEEDIDRAASNRYWSNDEKSYKKKISICLDTHRIVEQ
jgi:hypothetical protein